MSDLLTRMIEAAERDNDGPLSASQRKMVEQAARDTEAACAYGRMLDGLMRHILPSSPIERGDA